MKELKLRHKGLMLALAAVIGLGGVAACAGDGDGAETTTTVAAGTDATGDDSTETTSGEDGTEDGIVAKGEELPIVQDTLTYQAAVMQQSALKQAKDKEAVKMTEEATNIHIEWSEVPTSGWTERMNILFSTNSLPDMILGEVVASQNYEQLLAFDDYLEDYAPNTVQFLKDRPEYDAALRAPDGLIHSLPTGDEAYPNQVDAKMWINVEWLDNLGLEMPTTTAEFEEVLYAFKNDDPNGNGEQDEIPLTFREVWGWAQGAETFFGPFGVIENSAHVFVNDEDTVVFSPAEEGYRDALRWFNKLYEDEVLDSEAFIMSSEEYAVRDGGRDIVGVFAGYNPSEVGVDNGEDGDRYQGLPALVGPNGDQMVGFNYILREEGFSISLDAEHPEALVRWYDYVNSSQEMTLIWGRGAEGEFWEWAENDDGETVPMFIERTAEEWNELGYTSRAEYRNAESFGGQSPSLWTLDMDRGKVIDPKAPTNYAELAIASWEPYAVFGLPPGSPTVENAERRTILLTDINNYLLRFISDSVMNGLSDEDWEAHLGSLDDLHADEYLTLAQEYTDSVLGND